jgi:hypothetical protein
MVLKNAVFNVIHFNRHAYILLKDYYLQFFFNSMDFSKRCSIVSERGDKEKGGGICCVQSWVNDKF